MFPSCERDCHLNRIWSKLALSYLDESGRSSSESASRLQSGERLNSAIEAECADLPPIYRATMLAGTLSGQPGKSIEMLVDTARRMQQIRRVTGLALLYPLIVFTVTSLLFGLVVTCIVPSFAWLNHLHFGFITVLSDWPLASIILAVTLPVLVASGFIAWWWRSGKNWRHFVVQVRYSRLASRRASRNPVVDSG